MYKNVIKLKMKILFSYLEKRYICFMYYLDYLLVFFLKFIVFVILLFLKVVVFIFFLLGYGNVIKNKLIDIVKVI